jgi:uroporphyrin-III C-methyltransferase/precorrin-2 dehydrogenase/sirohydrochlorin ferrochelatase/uroporphyrin-III C-methyltransferase
MSQTPLPAGKVIIAGAGPGDPELITRKAARYLGLAEIVLTDRLVSDQLLRELVNPAARVIYVGKQCRKGSSTPQETINELMVQYASEGKLVVRLKGGDISVFSNILDELETLIRFHIPYELIPGVSAALGAAAYSGIPLTARNYSTGIRFLTYYKSDVIDESYWQELAQTRDTLVFYMSGETTDQLVKKLIQHHISKECWMAVIEQATTPYQKITNLPVHAFPDKAATQSWVSPTLVVIGRVASLHQQFRWLPDCEQSLPYFNAVANLSHLQQNNPQKDAARA